MPYGLRTNLQEEKFNNIVIIIIVIINLYAVVLIAHRDSCTTDSKTLLPACNAICVYVLLRICQTRMLSDPEAENGTILAS